MRAVVRLLCIQLCPVAYHRRRAGPLLWVALLCALPQQTRAVMARKPR